MCAAAPVEESLKKTYLVQVPPVCVFRWGSLLLTCVFSRHRMSDGQTFFRAKRWALENNLARFIGIIGDSSQCRGQVIVASGLIALGAFTPDFRESAVKPVSQPLRPWQTYGIAIESQRKEKTWKYHLDLVFFAISSDISVVFTTNYCIIDFLREQHHHHHHHHHHIVWITTICFITF